MRRSQCHGTNLSIKECMYNLCSPLCPQSILCCLTSIMEHVAAFASRNNVKYHQEILLESHCPRGSTAWFQCCLACTGDGSLRGPAWNFGLACFSFCFWAGYHPVVHIPRKPFPSRYHTYDTSFCTVFPGTPLTFTTRGS